MSKSNRGVGLRWSSIKTETDLFSPLPYETSKVTPIVGLTYDLTTEVSLYTSYTKGLESGGRAPASAVNGNQQMPALETEAVEVGIKSDLLGGALTLDASVFQIQKTAAFTNAVTNVFEQSGLQVHKGAELLIKGQATKNLTLSGGMQWIDARLTGNPANEGSRPVNVPRLRATAFADYKVDSVPGLFINGLVSYVGERELQVPNVQSLDGHVLANLGARYETKVNGVPVIGRLTVFNALNRPYYSAITFAGGEIGASRVVRGSVEVRF